MTTSGYAHGVGTLWILLIPFIKKTEAGPSVDSRGTNSGFPRRSEFLSSKEKEFPRPALCQGHLAGRHQGEIPGLELGKAAPQQRPPEVQEFYPN